MENKIRFGDLSIVLKIATIGGLMMVTYISVVIISFIIGMIIGTIIG